MGAQRGSPVILTKSDAGMLDRFLLQRSESSLVLLSNARSAGLDDRGGILEGTYAAYREGDGITGVAAHFWNGMVILQAPADPLELVKTAVAASGRKVTGLAGPCRQVRAVLREFIGKDFRPVINAEEILYSLDLPDLTIPLPLLNGDVACRHPADEELALLTGWRMAFMQEHLGASHAAARQQEASDLVRHHHRTNSHWILETNGTPVATAAVSAGIDTMVQIGGVYTVPQYRNRGYGRAVVAGSLLDLKKRGVKKAILYTGTDMPAAQTMYQALGFRQIGRYGLVIL